MPYGYGAICYFLLFYFFAQDGGAGEVIPGTGTGARF